ncbi:hypothetical protein RclHR1_00850013 [Rhizophagus clarus]|uniref:Uncharacterized protein n=1 Tax=Rhizophagus clarus TaxID=94130 RepID=A0A2Z6SG43_9GLOM|nr:hypothetical protein RclHR1_00850013 [Rhizophagus clarus]GES98104.1 hypothetical protein GLOIN_2v1471941 [Rhizophagus clarus]
MDNSKNLSQNNLNNGIHESNFTESLNGLNNHSDHLQQTNDVQEGNINSNDTSYNYNDNFSATNENDNISSTYTNVSDPNYQRQYATLNDNPHHNNQHQQSTYNNVSSPQFYYDQNQYNPTHSNNLPLPNSFGININSPQSTIIFLSTASSDIQNQLQQILNHSSSKTSSETRF